MLVLVYGVKLVTSAKDLRHAGSILELAGAAATSWVAQKLPTCFLADI